MKWETVERVFCRAAFVILFIGCVVTLLDFKLRPPNKVVNKIIEVEKIVEVDNGWHLPDLTSKGYVTEIRYRRIK